MIIESGSFYVYVHTNKSNGKRYVGITGRDPIKRWNGNGTGYINCDKFWKAIQKYGWDNFEHEIFASGLTKEEAENMERFLIEKLDTICNGYNINAGGYVCKHNPGTIEKIRQANIGKYVSDETRAKIKAARANQVISMESIMKTAEKNRGRKRSDEFKEKERDIKRQFMKKVLVVETGEVYDSICEAARKLDINKSSVSCACRGKCKTAKGLHMQFVNA